MSTTLKHGDRVRRIVAPAGGDQEQYPKMRKGGTYTVDKVYGRTSTYPSIHVKGMEGIAWDADNFELVEPKRISMTPVPQPKLHGCSDHPLSATLRTQGWSPYQADILTGCWVDEPLAASPSAEAANQYGAKLFVDWVLQVAPTIVWPEAVEPPKPRFQVVQGEAIVVGKPSRTVWWVLDARHDKAMSVHLYHYDAENQAAHLNERY